MTDAEHELLIAVAKALVAGLDTPFTTRRRLQELLRQITEDDAKG